MRAGILLASVLGMMNTTKETLEILETARKRAAFVALWAKMAARIGGTVSPAELREIVGVDRVSKL